MKFTKGLVRTLILLIVDVAVIVGVASVALIIGSIVIIYNDDLAKVETTYTMRVVNVQDVENSNGPSKQEMRQVEMKCKSDYDMAFYIQKTRIRTHDTWDEFKTYVTEGYHPGEPLGLADTPEQIEIKDAFWKKTLVYAELVYTHWDVSVAPDKVASVFAEACIFGEQEKLYQKYNTNASKHQEYDI